MAGTLTRDEMVTEICDVCGKAEAASAISGATLQTRARRYLNWGQKRVARFYNFHELNTYTESAATVTDVKRYPMVSGTNNLGLVRPKDIASIRLIDIENSRKIERWSYRKFDRYFPRPENYATARPNIYVRWGSDLEFFRVPNAVYTLYIRYPQWPIDISTNTTSVYNDKDQLLITAGILETYLALEEYEDAEVWYARFLGQLKDAVHVEGDTDWEPQAEPYGMLTYRSGEPWTDPYGTMSDPLWGYPE